ncbi:recombination protein RecR [Spiroplasma sabaudiense Ar-1343]|uniref:Recombination protein RecR n=1 Tax=Spiroplasma sabaudiense Ar-1343 TaxID=1276257 RepID=W6A953_9MOLU|nr:recombination mediator RecR [Spiroplasma sabaudiense]AHI53420.1 recombination protein RecR [Spiroplasma sabaudiense Ar-1343]
MKDSKIEELIYNLSLNKGFSKKNSERIIFDLITSKDRIVKFKDIINYIEESLSECPICFYYTENQICEICQNSQRDKNQICVVSSISDAHTIEKSNLFKGVYHVLKGEINLNKNKTPDKLTINELLSRVNENSEVILALNSTFEGEVTANFIAGILRKKTKKITRIAKGIPFGGMLDYIDDTTLKIAIKNREKYED